MGLNGKTFAEAAGIDMDLGENKLQVCQINAMIKGPIMPWLLADLCDTLMSSMDDDSIRIIPKTRMLKKSGHKVDNVLKNHGF